MEKRQVILDTDIGSDIDDLWALIYLLADNNIDLKGIAVTSGDTEYKANLVMSILHRCGRDDIPVIAGKSTEMANKPQEKWINGNKFIRSYELDYQVGMKNLILLNPEAAIFLIGPVNDFGELIKNNPDIVKNRNVYFMGGAIYKGYVGQKEAAEECNVVCSIEGSRTLLKSGANLYLLPLDVNRDIQIKGKNYKNFLLSSYKYASIIKENYFLWQKEYEGGALKFDASKESSRLFDLSVPAFFADKKNFVVKKMPISVNDRGITVVDETDGTYINVVIHEKNKNKSITRFLNTILLRKKHSTPIKRIKNNWQMLIFALPAIVIVGIFCYAPMFGIVIAFQDFQPFLGIGGSQFVGFDNFNNFFHSTMFWTTLKNTLIISFYALAVNTIVPIFIAILINEVASRKFKRFFQLVSYAPYFISLVVLVGVINAFLSSTGFLNNLAASLGLGPTDYLTSEKSFYSVFVLTGLWAGCGWWSIIYVNALAAVPQDLHEAAAIDGAGRFRRIWYINLPYVRPTILTLFILAVGSIMSLGFEKIILMQNAGNYYASEIISSYVYNVGLTGNVKDYGLGAAVGLFNSVINCILLIVANLLSKKFADKSLL